jgi:hypothetical protein
MRTDGQKDGRIDEANLRFFAILRTRLKSSIQPVLDNGTISPYAYYVNNLPLVCHICSSVRLFQLRGPLISAVQRTNTPDLIS